MNTTKYLPDSQLIDGLFTEHECDELFNTLQSQTNWKTMTHRGGDVPRLLSIQHTDYPDKRPIYRHPADIQPKSETWSSVSYNILQRVSDYLKIDLNHALIQYYRSGSDYISEHADKTLDILKNTPIINVSFGAVRTMKLRSKYKNPDGTREIHNIKLKNGSVFVLGWETNKNFTHSIKQDKRIDSIKSEDELAFNGQRISLTFRNIATFMDSSGKLFGQGAPTGEYINDADQMLIAFGIENKSYNYDWDEVYGAGFHSVNFEEL
jgi:alkylated DNA repair dioxygenase AlkB